MEVPAEIFCHILNFVSNFNDVISCKRVSWLFYNEIKSRKSILNVVDVKWNEEAVSYFANRAAHKRASKEEVKQYWIAQQSAVTDPYHLVKIVLFGPFRSGKTTLMQTISEERFREDMSPGGAWIDFVIKRIKCDNDITIKLQIWDTYYYDRFKKMSATHFRGAHVIFLCFAIDDRSSFIELMEVTLNQCYNFRDMMKHVQFYLVGLKNDRDTTRAVIKDEAYLVASELNMKYFEVSSKLHPNGKINEMLHEIGEEAMAQAIWKIMHKVEDRTPSIYARTNWAPNLPWYKVNWVVVSIIVICIALIIAMIK